MPRLSEVKRNELEAFWRAHIQGWRDSSLNQREYCEAHGLPLKRFGNWRAEVRHEDPRFTGKLLYRRGGAAEHMLKHMRSDVESPYIPSGRSAANGRLRNFGPADNRRIVDEACCHVHLGACVTGKKANCSGWTIIEVAETDASHTVSKTISGMTTSQASRLSMW